MTQNFKVEEIRDGFGAYICCKQQDFETRHSLRTSNVIFLYMLFFVVFFNRESPNSTSQHWSIEVILEIQLYLFYWSCLQNKRVLTELGDGEQSMILSMYLKEESVWE